MIWQKWIVAAALAVTGVQAGGIGDLIVEGMSRNSPAYERRMAEIAKRSLVIRGALLEMRQASSAELIAPNGAMNMSLWDAIANAACVKALQQLPEASNPSGTCVCYNVPILDRPGGKFVADLRLYQLGTARDDFSGIPPEAIEVNLGYKGANVSPTTPEQAAQKISGASILARQSPAELNGDLKLLQTYMFLGEIDQTAEKVENMTMGTLQSHLLPVVTLSGRNAQNQVVSTNVSTTEAAFVAGEFAADVVMSSFAEAELAVEEEIARLKNGTTAFVLPGVQILIFPIGLVITSIWLVLGLAAYGYGTFCRYNFREQYRRRMLIQQKSAVPRF
ncbi:hypothetical protein V8F33_009850 [Rhypophila sp. PSN 637]